MGKVADVKLSWTKSPSLDITGVKAIVNLNGQEQTFDFGPEVESFQITCQPMTSGSFKVVVTGTDGQTATSTDCNFSVGTLEGPHPVTDLTAQIVAIRDDTPPPPVNPPSPDSSPRKHKP